MRSDRTETHSNWQPPPELCRFNVVRYVRPLRSCVGCVFHALVIRQRVHPTGSYRRRRALSGYDPCHVSHVCARCISRASPFPPAWTQIYTRVVSADVTRIRSRLIRASHCTCTYVLTYSLFVTRYVRRRIISVLSFGSKRKKKEKVNFISSSHPYCPHPARQLKQP